jgi:hypothetical protein
LVGQHKDDKISFGNALAIDYNTLALSSAPMPSIETQKQQDSAPPSAYSEQAPSRGPKDETISQGKKPILSQYYDIQHRKEGQQDNVANDESDVKNAWYLPYKHEPDWSALKTPQVISKVMKLLDLTRETSAIAQRAGTIAQQEDLFSTSSTSDSHLERDDEGVAPDEDVLQSPGELYADDDKVSAPTKHAVSNYSANHCFEPIPLGPRPTPVGLHPQPKDEDEDVYQELSSTKGNDAAVSLAQGKKRDSTYSEDTLPIPPVPPRPATRRLSAKK